MKKKLLTAAFMSMILVCSAQPFQKEYTTGIFPNQTSTKGYDAEPTLNGYTAYTETSTEKHLVLTNTNGTFQSALRVSLNQTNVIGEGSTFAELNNGDYFVAGTMNGNLVFYSFAPAGFPFTYDVYQMQGANLAINEFMQIIQVENYDDEHVYVRGIYRSQSNVGGPGPGTSYLHFLCMARREGQVGNYQYSVQWIKSLESPIDINYSLYNDDGRYGDMHVSAINGDLYYVGKSIEDGSGTTPYWHLRKFNVNGTELYKKVILDVNYFEPTGVVESTDGADIFVCGFNGTKSFVSKFNAGNGTQTWFHDYYINSYTYYKFRSIEYSSSTTDIARVKVVGQARSGKTFGFSLAISHNTGQPISYKTYYDYLRIDEIALDGPNNYILTGSTSEPNVLQPIYGIGLLKTDNILQTNCSSYLAPPSYSIPVNYINDAYPLTNLGVLPVITPEGGVPMMSYGETNACCKLAIANQTVYLCDPAVGVSLDPGNFSNYLWDDGSKTRTIRVYQPGLHSVTVFDQNGCWALVYFTIIQTPNIGFGVSSTTPISCFGANDGNVCFTSLVNIVSATIVYPGSGGPQNVNIGSSSFCFYNLIGLTSNPGLAPGYYSITVYDQFGCSETYTFNLTQPAQLVISSSNVSASPDQCNGQLNLFVNGGIAPYTATITGPGSFNYTGNPLNTFINLCAGCYTVYVQDANGCAASSTCEPVSGMDDRVLLTAGINKAETETPQINIFPNPVNDLLSIESSKDILIDVYNILGEKLNSFKTVAGTTHVFNVNSLPKGIYILKSEATQQSIRIIKN